MEISEMLPDWAMGLDCPITVCDHECTIIYMNGASRKLYASHGNLIGKNLLECHNPRSQEIIRRLLREGGTNVYTIEKRGVHKLIYQCGWRRPDGTVGGVAEISIITPEGMPHYVRG